MGNKRFILSYIRYLVLKTINKSEATFPIDANIREVNANIRANVAFTSEANYSL